MSGGAYRINTGGPRAGEVAYDLRYNLAPEHRAALLALHAAKGHEAPAVTTYAGPVPGPGGTRGRSAGRRDHAGRAKVRACLEAGWSGYRITKELGFGPDMIARVKSTMVAPAAAPLPPGPPGDDRVAALVEAGSGTNTIKDALRVGAARVRRVVRERGLTLTDHRLVLPDVGARARAMLAAGATYLAVEAACGLHPDTICKIKREVATP